MSNKPGIGSAVQCPFYKGLRSRSIICEAVIDSAESTGDGIHKANNSDDQREGTS